MSSKPLIYYFYIVPVYICRQNKHYSDSDSDSMLSIELILYHTSRSPGFAREEGWEGGREGRGGRGGRGGEGRGGEGGWEGGREGGEGGGREGGRGGGEGREGRGGR